MKSEMPESQAREKKKMKNMKLDIKPAVISDGDISTCPSIEDNLQDHLENCDKESQELPSPGSANHPDKCRPCSFMHTLAGCDKGDNCDFCHFRHKNKPRLNKQKRRRIKELIERKNALAYEVVLAQ
jgi:C4-type Zn-finger protein